jgi:hypothetical protein
MVKDQKLAAKRGEVGPLDFDPIIDAQDWNVVEFDIAVTDAAPGRASATVNFLLDLVAVKKEWRIRDITWQVDGKHQTLRGIYVH